MITLEEYYRIQQVKAGLSNHATNPRSLENTDFPLRAFVLCMCGRPLTASWSQGRNKKYAYYLCKNNRCEHYSRSIAKKRLEEDFIRFLESISPIENFLATFKAIMIDSWENRHIALKQERKTYESKLKTLEGRREKLIKMRLENEISKDEFFNIRRDLENQISVISISKNEANIEELDIEASLSYATQFIRDISRQWQDMKDIKQKCKLQRLVLPNRVTYNKTNGNFRTAVLSPIFELNRQFTDGESDMVAAVGLHLNQLVGEIALWYEFSESQYQHAQY
jgi:hypothetical protein